MLPELAALEAGLREQIERLTQLERDIAMARSLFGHCRDCLNRPNCQDCPHCEVDKQVELSDIARLIWAPDIP